MLRFTRVAILGACMAACAPATTLELLGFDRLIAKATQVVRGRIGNCEGTYRGSMIYTQCTVSVLETLKGAPASQVKISVPGGHVGRIRQSIAGAPKFRLGSEYVLFLWTSPTVGFSDGFTQIMGLSQGKFEVQGAGPTQTAVRTAVADVTMLDGMGQPVEDAGVRMTVAHLREMVAAQALQGVQK